MIARLASYPLMSHAPGHRFFILGCSAVLYFFVVGWTYPMLVEGNPHMEELSVIFAMSIASGYWSVLCIVLGFAYFLEKRADIGVRPRATEPRALTAAHASPSPRPAAAQQKESLELTALDRVK